MSKEKWFVLITVLLVCAMIIHVGVRMYIHSQHPEFSSPIYVELFHAVYYLIPLIVLNLLKVILRK
jgi:hypothetical protein